MRDGRDLDDRADGKAVSERMRRGEPAPTVERARVEADFARGVLRTWWVPWAYLCLGVFSIVLLVSEDHVVGRVLALQLALGCLGFAAWRELHRRGAALLLDANQRRWGDV
jgi:hypothetical protein